jgi:hypothetical protein
MFLIKLSLFKLIKIDTLIMETQKITGQNYETLNLLEHENSAVRVYSSSQKKFNVNEQIRLLTSRPVRTSQFLDNIHNGSSISVAYPSDISLLSIFQKLKRLYIRRVINLFNFPHLSVNVILSTAHSSLKYLQLEQ